MRGNLIEAIPSDAAYPAVIIGFDLESRRGERERGKLRDWSGRQERDQDVLGSNVQARNACGSSQKDVRTGGQLRFAHDYVMPGEVGGLHDRQKLQSVGVGKPGKCGERAQKLKIGRARSMFTNQVNIYGRRSIPFRLIRETSMFFIGPICRAPETHSNEHQTVCRASEPSLKSRKPHTRQAVFQVSTIEVQPEKSRACLRLPG